MTRSVKFATIMQVIAVLSLLVMSQVVLAQPDTDAPDVPQWVIDVRQYEPGYVYVPAQSRSSQPRQLSSQSAAARTLVPQWVIDRQQYEPNYVYVPHQFSTAPSAASTVPVPQWVIDRQQYEPSYIYVPPVP